VLTVVVTIGVVVVRAIVVFSKGVVVIVALVMTASVSVLVVSTAARVVVVTSGVVVVKNVVDVVKTVVAVEVFVTLVMATWVLVVISWELGDVALQVEDFSPVEAVVSDICAETGVCDLDIRYSLGDVVSASVGIGVVATASCSSGGLSESCPIEAALVALSGTSDFKLLAFVTCFKTNCKICLIIY
jgi:hypothetical protein